MCLTSLCSASFALFLTGCGGAKSSDVVSSLECVANSRASADCAVMTASEYVYPSAYGGRSINGSSILTPTNGLKTYTIPTGWYSESTITFSDTDLAAANISNGVSIAGVTGTFITAAQPACTMTNGGGLQASICSAQGNTYNYANGTGAYGGRGAACDLNSGSSFTGSCWLVPNTSATVGTAAPATNAPCSGAAQGLQATACTAPANGSSYHYTSASGGRSLGCETGYNLNACWLTTTGNMISSSPILTCTYGTSLSGPCLTGGTAYVYAVAYGGRNTDCTNDNAGNCFVSQASKSLLEPNLISNNIAVGQNIFGVTGKFSGPSTWYSGAHHSQGTNPITFSEEALNYAASGTSPNLPLGYREIPSFQTYDDDGYSGLGVSSKDRTGWGSTTCGTTQITVALRIADCANIFGVGATWDGTLNGNAGQTIWVLVTRTGANSNGMGREVWKDTKTGLLWSSLVSKNINWCQASGSSNAVNVAAANKEADPSAICTNASYQNQTTAWSACYEGAGFANTGVLVPVPSLDNTGKGGMALAATGSSPAVAWRIPTFNDYEIADYHGLRFVMPDIGSNGVGEEWTGTVNSTNVVQAWTYSSVVGSHSSRSRGSGYSVRCVGR